MEPMTTDTWIRDPERRAGSHVYSGFRMVMKAGESYTLHELEHLLAGWGPDEVEFFADLMVQDGFLNKRKHAYTLTERAIKELR